MRIGINCININPDYAGGLKTFTFGLLDGLCKTKTTHQIIIFAEEKNKHFYKSYLSDSNIKFHAIKNPHKLIISLDWKCIQLPKAIYHLIKNFLYRKQTK